MLTCSGSTCGMDEDEPCASKPGGLPGATFTYCGCADVEGTPFCCYPAVEDGGTPFGNGGCRDFGGPNNYPGCPAGFHCEYVDEEDRVECQGKKIHPI